MWYLEYMEGIERMSWAEFGRLVVERFSNAEGVNLVAQFNKLKQSDNVMSYTLQFEELKAFMVSENRKLKKSYFVQSCISVLKDEIARIVEMFNPSSLNKTIQLARKQELQLLSMGREIKQSGWQKGRSEEGNRVTQEIKSNMFKKLTHAEIEERRKKKLRFNSDEPYQLGA